MGRLLATLCDDYIVACERCGVSWRDEDVAVYLSPRGCFTFNGERIPGTPVAGHTCPTCLQADHLVTYGRRSYLRERRYYPHGEVTKHSTRSA